MADELITREIQQFLKEQTFINIATSDFDGRPNVAPKFLLKVEDDVIYLIDYVIGRTFRNLKNNPNVSLSTVDLDTLVGYQINGKADIVEDGQDYKKLLQQMYDRQIEFSTKRIIEGIRSKKKHAGFEVTFPDRVVMFKIKAEEIVEIGPSGKIERKRSEAKQKMTVE